MSSWGLEGSSRIEQDILKCADCVCVCVCVVREMENAVTPILFERILQYLRNTAQGSMLGSTGINVRLCLVAQDLRAQTSTFGMIRKKR